MSEKEDYKRIRVGIVIHKDSELNPNLAERCTDYENEFADRVEQEIRVELGEYDWGVWFSQVNELTPKFYVSIYIDDFKNYEKAAFIIREKIGNDFEVEITSPTPFGRYRSQK